MEKIKEIIFCKCDIIILHCYIIKNKFNNKLVHPIGRVCILQFLPEPEKERLQTFHKFLIYTLYQIKKNRIKEMTTEERIEYYKKENEKRKKRKEKKEQIKQKKFKKELKILNNILLPPIIKKK